MEEVALHDAGRPGVASPLGRSTAPQPTHDEASMGEAVEVYHRTYTTILRSSGETQLKVFETSHKAMGSSLHPLAGSPGLDLGAFLYSIRRLPGAISRAQRVVMGQSAEVFLQRGYAPFSEGTEIGAPGR